VLSGMSGFVGEAAVVRDGFSTPFTGNDPASARLIELEHPEIYREGEALATHAQDLCNAVAGVEGRFVPFTGRSRRGGTVLHLDLATIEAALPPLRAAAGQARLGARHAAAALAGSFGT
jgi:hypothetical protein